MDNEIKAKTDCKDVIFISKDMREQLWDIVKDYITNSGDEVEGLKNKFFNEVEYEINKDRFGVFMVPFYDFVLEIMDDNSPVAMPCSTGSLEEKKEKYIRDYLAFGGIKPFHEEERERLRKIEIKKLNRINKKERRLKKLQEKQ